MIESPVLDEVKELIRKRAEAEATVKARIATLREATLATLETRFGTVPAERVASLQSVVDEARLKELHRLAITCADLDAFVAELSKP